MDGVNEFRSTPKGTLRINSHERAARMILPSILRFLEHYPEMKLDLVTEGRLIDIVAEGFDAGIRLEESVPKDMIAVRCSPPLRFAVVGAPAYFKSRPRPKVPADLYTHECLKGRMPSGAPYQWDFEKRGEQQVIDVSGRILLDNHNIMLDAVLEGAGLGYMTEWLVEPGLKSGRLVRVLEDWTPPLSCLCVYYPSHRHPSAGLRAFIEFMREAFTD
jgi:DNA-binding transcriptional LysR family regulator